MISGGENIATVEFENVIFQHSDVLEIALFPIPDEKRGALRKALGYPRKAGRPRRKV